MRSAYPQMKFNFHSSGFEILREGFIFIAKEVERSYFYVGRWQTYEVSCTRRRCIRRYLVGPGFTFE